MWKEQSLSKFLADFCTKHECPSLGLSNLFETTLAAGNCLVLLDGLDEIVDADERRGIVQAIEDFIRRHGDRTNRFVITSRVAGYRSAPLSGPFSHYTVQEMTEAQMLRFLEQWCPAVEAAQTPEISQEARQAVAQREIYGITQAVKSSPGVRRLAANPLLLRTLALIHRTGAQLPQKRIELYKLAVDTLARTWRTAQGVPESALVEERYLTRLLSKLAYWLHVEKPSGIATEREVYNILGAEWAQIKQLAWDENDPDPDIMKEVEKFLLAVREHTGLFVERAPKRYGFMHLTFEEYYVARHLVMRRRDAAVMIRRHLHDPRWDEPILLALGFVGLDYPEETEELFETAILAEGEEAQNSGITPSPYEEILGRDYLFALRCLGDQIPAAPQIIHTLMKRLSEELVYQTGSARFRRYREVLEERLSYLPGSEAATELNQFLIIPINDEDSSVRISAAQSLGQLGQASPEVTAALIQAFQDEDSEVRIRAAQSLGQLGHASPEVITALIQAFQHEDSGVRFRAVQSLGQLGQASPEVTAALIQAFQDEDSEVRIRAAQSLGQLGQASPEVITALIQAFQHEDSEVRIRAAQSLGQLGQASPEVITALIQAFQHEDSEVRIRAAQSLGQLGQASPEVITALIQAFQHEDSEVRIRAAQSLGQLGQASPEVITALIQAFQHEDSEVRIRAVQSLGQLGQASPEVTAALIQAFQHEDSNVRFRAAQSLGQLGQASPEVITALIQAFQHEDSNVRFRAAQSLGQLGQASPEVITALIQAFQHEDSEVRIRAAQSLGQLGQASPEVITALIQAFQHERWTIRRDAARILGQIAPSDETIILPLWRGILDSDDDVRTACAESLAALGRRFPETRDTIIHKLVHAITDEEFDEPDEVLARTGHDYAFGGLWLLVTGKPA